jgi:hypothetical protein
MSKSKRFFSAVVTLIAQMGIAHAWDYEGHRIVNQLALHSLPTNFPSFVQTSEARERIAFLSGEADRWRNTADVTLRHCNNPDHFLDVDLLPDHGLSAESLTRFRYDFAVQLAQARAANPDAVPRVDRVRDPDHTKALIGFLPWTITEYHSKLRSAFSYLRTFEEAGGTSEEITNAQQNVIYVMGVMGHFVGDGAQPLHTTKHYNGWIGENPKGYTTNRTFHQWIDGGYISRAKIAAEELMPKVRPASALQGSETNVFRITVAWLVEQHKLVESLYELDMKGKLSGRRISSEGRDFIAGQLLSGGQMLGNLWYSAWWSAETDRYLRGELTPRMERARRGTECRCVSYPFGFEKVYDEDCCRPQVLLACRCLSGNNKERFNHLTI